LKEGIKTGLCKPVQAGFLEIFLKQHLRVCAGKAPKPKNVARIMLLNACLTGKIGNPPVRRSTRGIAVICLSATERENKAKRAAVDTTLPRHVYFSRMRIDL
jgi:hypothetical protein